jgi:UDP-N-acetylglucosamine acyltransferase
MNGLRVANSIHLTAIIGEDVSLGDNNVIGPLAVLNGPLSLGDNNWIGAGVVLGAAPEVRSLYSEDDVELSAQAGLHIGNSNVIREYAQIHQGWKKQTRIGDGCYIMNQVYIAHDCIIRNNVTLASSVLLAGHVNLGESANLGMGAMVHQNISVGPGAMIGMGSVVVKPIPMFAKAYGNPARVHGTNSIGMERLGLSERLIRHMIELNHNPDRADLASSLASEPELSKFMS